MAARLAFVPKISLLPQSRLVATLRLANECNKRALVLHPLFTSRHLQLKHKIGHIEARRKFLRAFFPLINQSLFAFFYAKMQQKAL